MNVVRHHDIGMELVVSEILISIVDGVDHHACNLGPSQEERAGDSKIENAIHGEEGSSGGGHRGEGAIRRQAAMQTPGEEDGLADGMIMRQPATMEDGHEEKVGVGGKILTRVGGAIANRPQVNNLPHTEI